MNKDFNLVKEVIVSFVLAAVICAVLSAVMNYFVIKMPDSETTNAINHGVSGFISGGISGIAGTLITAKKLMKK
jgi:Trk-type K+ transport system membrane component